jgi:hypothetical protein
MMKGCSKCGEVKQLTSFHKLSSSKDGYRPDCKDCCKKQRDARNNKDIIMYKARIMGVGVLQRTKYEIDKKQNLCYNNIKCTIGDTPKEVADYLYNNFYNEIKDLIDNGKIPSVDRVDSNGDYCEDNIRVIDLAINTEMGRENAIKKTSKPIFAIKGEEVVEFSSISEASRELGMKRDTIHTHLNKGTVCKKGYSFTSEE